MAKRCPEPFICRDVSDAESGQASILLILVLGIFLIASLGFAVDLSSMWFQRQSAQSAADAACLAGAMDMLYLHNGTITSSPGFIPGTASDCSASPTAAICWYAIHNGFTSTTAASGLAAASAGAVAVNWTFPTSVSGATASGVANPFLRVVVQQKAPTWFIGLVGIRSMTVGASCTCGLPPGTGVAPILVLNPTLASALSLSGGTNITITGGPPVSIQVNSSSPTAVACSGGSGNPIDTSTAGPSGAGGKLSIVGGPTLNPFCGALKTLMDPNNLLWVSSAGSVPNPYASVPTPINPGAPLFMASTPIGDSTGCIQNAVSSPSTNACGRRDPTYGLITGIWVGPGTDSCPATSTSTSDQHYMGTDPGPPYSNYSGSCLEFSPGYYPYGINLNTLAEGQYDVSIFQPGIYYLNGDLNVASSSTIRNAWIGTQPSMSGVIFYFLTGGPTFAGASGTPHPGYISSVPSYYLNCLGTGTPSGLPVSLSGNVLVSQCSTGGTYVGSPSSDSYSTTGLRGLLFFTDPTDTYSNTLIGAGAYLSFSGALYFHNSSYTDQVSLSGAAGITTYSIGNIVVDQLSLSGGGKIQMGLTGASQSGPPTVGILQ